MPSADDACLRFPPTSLALSAILKDSLHFLGQHLASCVPYKTRHACRPDNRVHVSVHRAQGFACPRERAASAADACRRDASRGERGMRGGTSCCCCFSLVLCAVVWCWHFKPAASLCPPGSGRASHPAKGGGGRWVPSLPRVLLAWSTASLLPGRAEGPRLGSVSVGW